MGNELKVAGRWQGCLNATYHLIQPKTKNPRKRHQKPKRSTPNLSLGSSILNTRGIQADGTNRGLERPPAPTAIPLGGLQACLLDGGELGLDGGVVRLKQIGVCKEKVGDDDGEDKDGRNGRVGVGEHTWGTEGAGLAGGVLFSSSSSSAPLSSSSSSISISLMTMTFFFLFVFCGVDGAGGVGIGIGKTVFEAP